MLLLAVFYYRANVLLTILRRGRRARLDRDRAEGPIRHPAQPPPRARGRVLNPSGPEVVELALDVAPLHERLAVLHLGARVQPLAPVTPRARISGRTAASLY